MEVARFHSRICFEMSMAVLHNYVPHRRGGGYIVFGADLVGIGVSVGISVTLSCLHDIS